MGNMLESCGDTDNCCQNRHSRIISNSFCEKKKIPHLETLETEEIEAIENEEKIQLPQNVLNIPVCTNDLILERSKSPIDFYDEIETIGAGAFGLVKKVCLKSNPDTIRAMKIIPKKNLLKGINEANLNEEIYILKNLDHPNIMKLYEFYVDNDNFYIISEFFDQGDLFTKIEKLGTMNQIVVKFIMDQIFNAVAYLHSKGVLHGDIKLENVMLYTTTKTANQRFTMINKNLDMHKSIETDLNDYFLKNSKKKNSKTKKVVEDMTDYEIKLIDFGCSKLFSKKWHKKISGIIGTSIYCSPEVVDDLYDEKCDEWSCGVLTHILLSGEPPFYGDTEEEIFEKIKKCKYNFNSPKFNNVSENCKDLIRKLLEPNIKKRIKASEALRHPFFTEAFNPIKALTENRDLSVLSTIVNIKPLPSKFHETIVAFICVNYINKDEEKRLREVFRYIDKDGKNFLTKKSLEKCLKENGYLVTSEKLDYIIKSFDSDSNGTIEYQEFLRAVCDKESLFNDNNLKSAFISIDESKKGYIDANDIKNFIFQQKHINNKMLEDYLNQFGMKIKDKLKYDDFVYLIRNNKKLNNFNIRENKNNQIKNFNTIITESEKNLYFDIDEAEENIRGSKTGF